MHCSSFAADHQLIQVLAKRSLPIPCTDSRVLFTQEEAPKGVYILHAGEAALMMKSKAGGVVMCLHAEAGSLLGLPAIIADEPYSMTAMARKGSEVSFVTRADFKEMMQTEPLLFLKVLQVLAAEVLVARQAISEA